MENLSLDALNKTIMILCNDVDDIMTKSKEKVSDYLKTNGVTNGNITSEYILKNNTIDTLNVNNLFVKDLRIGGKSFIQNNIITYGNNTLELNNILLSNDKQVLFSDDTCFTSCYDGIYSVYLLKDKAEIVVSTMYDNKNIGDIIIPAQSLKEGENVFKGVTVIKNDDECSIRSNDSKLILINVIMR